MSDKPIPERKYCPNCGNTTYGECCTGYWNVVERANAAEAALSEARAQLDEVSSAKQNMEREFQAQMLIVTQQISEAQQERDGWRVLSKAAEEKVTHQAATIQQMREALNLCHPFVSFKLQDVICAALASVRSEEKP